MSILSVGIGGDAENYSTGFDPQKQEAAHGPVFSFRAEGFRYPAWTWIPGRGACISRPGDPKTPLATVRKRLISFPAPKFRGVGFSHSWGLNQTIYSEKMDKDQEGSYLE